MSQPGCLWHAQPLSPSSAIPGCHPLSQTQAGSVPVTFGSSWLLPAMLGCREERLLCSPEQELRPHSLCAAAGAIPATAKGLFVPSERLRSVARAGKRLQRSCSSSLSVSGIPHPTTGIHCCVPGLGSCQGCRSGLGAGGHGDTATSCLSPIPWEQPGGAGLAQQSHKPAGRARPAPRHLPGEETRRLFPSPSRNSQCPERSRAGGRCCWGSPEGVGCPGEGAVAVGCCGVLGCCGVWGARGSAWICSKLPSLSLPVPSLLAPDGTGKCECGTGCGWAVSWGWQKPPGCCHQPPHDPTAPPGPGPCNIWKAPDPFQMWPHSYSNRWLGVWGGWQGHGGHLGPLMPHGGTRGQGVGRMGTVAVSGLSCCPLKPPCPWGPLFSCLHRSPSVPQAQR